MSLTAALLVALAAPRTAAQCTDDYLEENDNCAQPALVYGGFSANLVSLYGDDDYFQVYLADGEDLTVDITFPHWHGDLDLYLYESGCTNILVGSTSITDDESVIYSNTSGAGKDLIVLVTMWAPNPDILCNDYGIAFGISTPVLCQDDSEYGNLNNDTCGDANLIFPGVAYLNFGVLDNDPDYYKLTVPAGSALTVDLTFSHALGDIDMVLYDSSCSTALAYAMSVTDDETLTWSNLGAVPVEVKWNVYILGATCNQYHMFADVVSQPCGPDDGLEPNDSCAQPYPLTPAMWLGMMVSTTDPDFYSIAVGQDEVLSIDASFTHAAGDVDIKLWDACGGSLLGASTSSTDNEAITWLNQSGAQATVFLEVLLYPGGVSECNRYDLDIGLAGTNPGTNFCTSLVNSSGAPAFMAALGSASVSANDLVLFGQSTPSNQNGIFFYGPNQVQLPFGNGFRCVGGGVHRLPVVNSGPGGQMVLALDYTTLGAASAIAPGSSWNFQAWFRDPPAGGAGFNLSDGYHISFLP